LHTKGRHSKHTSKIRRVLKAKMEDQVMHGQYIKTIDRQLISEGSMFLWLSRRDLKGETESEGIATQDQALQTKYQATKISTNRNK